MNNNLRKKYILSFSSLIIAVLFACGCLYAWFTMGGELTKVIDGINISVINIEDSTVKIDKVEGDGYFTDEDTTILNPGNLISIELSSDTNINVFSIDIIEEKLSSSKFVNFFSTRNDLLIGEYEKRIILNGISEEETIYKPFYIDDVVEGTDDEKIIQKVEFLRNFCISNSALSAITVYIKKNDETKYYLEKVNNSNVYTSNSFSQISMGEKFKVVIEYGLNDFYPFYSAESGTLQGYYLIKNYNCFIGTKLKVNFKTQ